MKEIVKIQEEFEDLISELEHLKKVNQMVSENTQNTDKVITEIKSFIESIVAFKASVTEDFDSKREYFEYATNSLNQSIKIVNKEANNNSKNVAKLLENSTEALKLEIKCFNDDINTTIRSHQLSLAEFNKLTENSISSKIQELQITITGAYELIGAHQKAVEARLAQIDKNNKDAFQKIEKSQLIQFVVLLILMLILIF